MSEGAAGERIARIVSETIHSKIDTEWQRVKPLVPIAVGDDELRALKAMIVDRIARTVPEVQPELEGYLHDKLDIASIIETKLANLPKPEFERILRGVFEEDEATLIVVGGVLGGAVGVLQGIRVLALNV